MTQDFSDDEYDYPDREPPENWIYQMNKDWYKPLFIKNICLRKVRHDTIYKKCKKELLECSWCNVKICPNKECISQYEIRYPRYTTPSKKHEKCLECDNITCCTSVICKNCEKRHTYDMITDKVAIGSYQASYNNFDIVVNLDYPYNKVKLGEIVCEKKGNTRIIKCGFIDTEKKGGGLTVDTLDYLLNKIEEFNDFDEFKDDPMILFHCYAGISRSATLAIAYLSKKQRKSIKEIYDLVKEKRPRINPNETFRKILGLN